ncbi:MAG: hypothetical protein IT317_09150 [Anaerolineales bacterium]|nr:hypothetical protein [Anaerolineales bacterium]
MEIIQNFYSLLGLRFTVPALVHKTTTFRAQVVSYIRRKYPNVRSFALVVNVLEGATVEDTEGKQYELFAAEHYDPDFPKGTLGRLDPKKTANAPSPGAYIAELRPTENPKVCECHLLPVPAPQPQGSPRAAFQALVRQIGDEYNLERLRPSEYLRLGSYQFPSPTYTRITLPGSVFIQYPQRPESLQHDFEKSTPSHLGEHRSTGRVTFLHDDTVILGIEQFRTPSTELGYGVLLMRKDTLRIYSMAYTVHNCAYYSGDKRLLWRSDPLDLLSDLQELFVLALYRPKFSSQLVRYASNHSEISRYLEDGYVRHAFRVRVVPFWPITCFACQEAKFIARQPNVSTGTSCEECLQDWKLSRKQGAPDT